MEIQWKNLIERAQNNDQAAFSELYEHSYDAVYRTVKSMVKDEDTAMDLVQDAFISGFANLEGFQPPENFIPWMRRIATNKARDWFRKKHDVAFSQLGDEEDAPPEFKDESPESSPEEVLDQQETSRLIEEILGTLSDEQRMAVGMYYYEEMPVAEIAEELGVSENTVKSRLNYGRKKIKAGVEELERKGTKLYSLAPVPFFLWLLHCQKAQAAIGALPAGGAPVGLLHNILEQVSALGAGAGTAAAASTATASTTAASTTAASTAAAAAVKGGIFASFGAKIAAGVAAAVLVGGVSVGVVSLTRGGLAKPEETLPGITSSESAQAPETNAPAETGSPTETTGSANPTEPEEITDSKGLKYELADGRNGYIVVGIGECTDTNIKIPATHEDLPVIGIGYAAFEECTGLTSVTIPASVTEIGEAAFSRCTGLTSITIPGSVTRIMSNAFGGCTGLTSITVAAGNPVYHSAGNCLIETGEKVLVFGCKTSEIPSDGSVTKIEWSAFSGCSGLTGITIPDGVTEIGNYAFESCTGLTSITIPGGVTKIGERAFAGCAGLTSITVAAGNPVYHSAGNCLIETKEKVLVAGCKTSEIPSDGSVTKIGSYAFEGCTGLTSITIPDGVTEIGNYAFESCTGLTSITIPVGVISIGGWAFEGCTGLTSIAIPNGVTWIGGCAFEGCTGLTTITIPDSVTVIGSSAFSGCTSLTSITIPGGVTSIGSGVITGCTGLTSITVAAGNPVYHSAGNCLIETKIGILIAGCKTSVIPNDGSVVAIGDEAFRYCTGLTSITIPDSMKGIGVYAFEGCTGLTSIEIPNGVAYFDTWAFAGCTGLTSITIPDSVEEIGFDAFSGCSSLTDISYGGSETQWAELTKEADVPETATVHYSSKG